VATIVRLGLIPPLTERRKFLELRKILTVLRNPVQRPIGGGVVDTDDRIGRPRLTLKPLKRLLDHSSVVKGNDE
jgi:hypothetical protein